MKKHNVRISLSDALRQSSGNDDINKYPEIYPQLVRKRKRIRFCLKTYPNIEAFIYAIKTKDFIHDEDVYQYQIIDDIADVADIRHMNILELYLIRRIQKLESHIKSLENES